MVRIRKSLNHNNKNYYGKQNKKQFITIHDTGNTSKAANAEMHKRYIENGSSATWHYSVDDKEAIQHFSHETQCWHAGDGRGNGNLNSIGIEICINSDGNYMKTIKNTVDLVKQLMKELNIPIQNIVQHNHWSGKNCPRQIRNGRMGVTWQTFINMVKAEKVVTSQSDGYSYFTDEVIKGSYGNGHDRREAHIYNLIRDRVNGKGTPKPYDDIVNQVKRGEFGNGHANRSSAIYKKVRELVNKKL